MVSRTLLVQRPAQTLLRAASMLMVCLSALNAKAQPQRAFADSLRQAYHIPGLAYAVVSPDTVLELQSIGFRKNRSDLAARVSDEFHLGSNSKSVTGCIATMLVSKGILRWDSRVVEVLPELRGSIRREYRSVTLLDLLTHRSRLPRCGIGDRFPRRSLFHGSDSEKRLTFGRWILQHAPAGHRGRIRFSNGGYIIAALMLERASQRSFEQLVQEFGLSVGIHIGFGYPNTSDSTQPYGHDERGHPLSSGDAFRESLLSAAGNLRMSTPDFAKFLQFQLRGLCGRSPLMDSTTCGYMHYCRSVYSVGWEWHIDARHRRVSDHLGSAGSFCSRAILIPESGRAIVIFTNASPDASVEAIDLLARRLQWVYAE